jgi:spore maturation protein B
MIQTVSRWLLPGFIFLILAFAATKRVKVYEVFLLGAEDGLRTGLRIFPYLLAIFTALAVFRSSGAMDFFLQCLAPLANGLGIPREILPLTVLKPLSGSGALGYMGELIQKHGPDSMVGRMAAAVQGSSETTVYVLTVYFGSVGIRKYRHMLLVGLFSDIVAFSEAILLIKSGVM